MSAEHDRPGLTGFGRWCCRLGIHTTERSQGVVGYCLRGCGDLKRWHTDGHIWTRFVLPSSGERPAGLPNPPDPVRRPGADA